MSRLAIRTAPHRPHAGREVEWRRDPIEPPWYTKYQYVTQPSNLGVAQSGIFVPANRRIPPPLTRDSTEPFMEAQKGHNYSLRPRNFSLSELTGGHLLR